MLTFIDLFAGVGGFRRGMELAGHKCVGFCEWDKFAKWSYTSMHLATEEQRNYLKSMGKLSDRQKEIEKDEYKNGEWYSNDIRNVDAYSMPKCDVWCFGAPCQDFSIAGARKGLEGNRSSLIREVFRIIREIKEEDRPQWLIYENVKGMFSSNKGFDYLEILLALDELGYDIEWQIFNSKYYGVPQNRERVYTIGHLRRYGIRKILPIEGTTGENSIKEIALWEGTKRRTGKAVYSKNGVFPCLTTKNHINDVGKVAITVLTPNRVNKRQNERIFKENEDPMFTLTSQDIQGVMVKEATKKGYAIAKQGDSINLEQPNSKTRRGRVGVGVAQTLTTSCNQATLDNMRIRKLTPRECFRLQGWTDEYFDRAALVNSDSQLYKQSGNGVTVNVVYEIAKRLEY